MLYYFISKFCEFTKNVRPQHFLARPSRWLASKRHGVSQLWCRSPATSDNTKVLGSFKVLSLLPNCSDASNSFPVLLTKSIAPGGKISAKDFREKMTHWGDEPLTEREVQCPHVPSW